MASLNTLRRLPASSLVEVTVASAILVLVFGLALASLTRLASTGPQQLQLRAQQLVARAAAETVRHREWQTRTWREGSVELLQEVLLTPQAPGLFDLRVTATVRGREIARFQQLVYAPSSSATP